MWPLQHSVSLIILLDFLYSGVASLWVFVISLVVFVLELLAVDARSQMLRMGLCLSEFWLLRSLEVPWDCLD